ncbi:hypothetical protein [Streptomyces purpurogeneiscleroticus]|uniref:hypothetical protein n=1 Tax=Streptomyces purpurogeneiscleroticus TaxID=68259 RepID=UPI001CBBDC0E|nr:hypothetical protein [Streptomyces purpurogeneiscleroticus]MBZ4016271.1 hypothetical protein [Streptomyces purpurogeneiscleroticus]
MSRIDEASASANSSAVRFGMPQALVLVAFLAAAVVLHLVARMAVRDVALLLTVAGGVGVAVLLAAHVRGGKKGGGGRMLRRLLAAVLSNGSGS